MNRNEKKVVRGERILWSLLAFLLPLAVLGSVMVVYGIRPFGDNSLIIIDGLHQYLPFFSVLYDKFKQGGSLFYSFRTGLGINFLSLFSYYLSSPFNALILLFPKKDMVSVLNVILVLKVALCGLTAQVYFMTKQKHPGMWGLLAAVTYALNSYMVGYKWNLMWLDAIMIFPIVLLGLERLIDKRDGRLYCLALFYAMYCNYYIAFMICIFMVIWFLLYRFKSIGAFFERGLAFAGWSILSAGLSAILLLPAYKGIKATASGDAMGLPTHKWLTSFWNLISRQYDLCSPLSHDNFDGNINLYFGIFAILCIFLYLANEKIALGAKIRKLLLIVFFYLSFNEYILNFIWHGFHDQYGIPNRFSFLYGFVLLIMMVELFENRDAIKPWQTIHSGALSIGLMVLCRFFATTVIADELYLLAGLLLLLYMILIFLLSYDKKHALAYGRVFVLVGITELACTVFNGEGNIGQIDMNKYFAATEYMDVATRDAREDAAELFFRSELADYEVVDESTWYDMNAVTLFGSTAMSTTVTMMDSLGFYTGCNEYLYKGANPVTNLMLGVRYLYYHEPDVLDTTFDFKATYGSMDAYVNPVEKLSVGYAIDSYIDNWTYNSAYPFVVLNDFCYQGYDLDGIFKKLKIDDPVVNGCTIRSTNEGEYCFHFKSQERDNLIFTLPERKKDGDLYIFYDGTQVNNASITVDGEERCYGSLDGAMQMVKDVPAASTVRVTMELKSDKEMGYIRLSAASFQPKKFRRLAHRMAERAMEVTEMTDTRIRGNVYVDSNQYLFLSIPYDEGWKAYVDGIETETIRIGNAFLGINTGEGNHDIVLSYTPPGFSLGWKLSLASLLILIMLFLLTPAVQRKRQMADARRAAYKRVMASGASVESEKTEGLEDTFVEGEKTEGLEDTFVEGEKTEGLEDTFVESEKSEGLEEASV